MIVPQCFDMIILLYEKCIEYRFYTSFGTSPRVEQVVKLKHKKALKNKSFVVLHFVSNKVTQAWIPLKAKLAVTLKRPSKAPEATFPPVLNGTETSYWDWWEVGWTAG